MHCEQVEALLARLVFDDLDEAAKRAALAHLSDCPACKDRFLEMRSAALLVREGLEAGPAPVLTPERKRALRGHDARRFATGGVPGGRPTPCGIPRRFSRKSVPRVRVLAGAAAILMVCGIAGVLVMSSAGSRYKRSDRPSSYDERLGRQMPDVAEKELAAAEPVPDAPLEDRLESRSFAGRIANRFLGTDGAAPAAPPAPTRSIEMSRLGSKAPPAGGPSFGWRRNAPESNPEGEKEKAERVLRAESEHNETADHGESLQAKGDSLDMLGNAPSQGPGAKDSIGVGGGGGGRYGSRSGGRRMAVARGGGAAAAPAAPASVPALSPESPAAGLPIVVPGGETGVPPPDDPGYGLAPVWDKKAEGKPGESRPVSGESESPAPQVATRNPGKITKPAEDRGRFDQPGKMKEEVKKDRSRNLVPAPSDRESREKLSRVEEMAKSLSDRDEGGRRELAQQDRYERALERLQEGGETSRPSLAGAILSIEDAPPPFVRLKPQEAGRSNHEEPRTAGNVKAGEGRVFLQEALPLEPDEALPGASRFKAGPVNPWVLTARDRLSTFALAVDTASYTLARRYLQKGFLPPAASVRMEEFVNAFDYNYPGQTSDVFAIHVEGAPSPFRPGLTLLKIGVKGKVLGREGRKPAHLVFVIDGSGSMARPDRLPLIQYALRELAGRLGPADRVSVVVFGTEARLAAEAVPAARRAEILAAIESVQPSGPTNLLLGLQLGYAVAQRQFRAGEINRVLLCTDGVANIGSSDADEMLANVKAYRDQGVTFTAAGFGVGSYNDALLARLAAQGDGRYVFIDSAAEARRVFVEEMAATLQSIAVDAKIQVEFDPARVRRYRLIGYEARAIRDEDFRNDAIEAAEVGSGQSATALYEVELADDGAWMAADDARAGTRPAPRRDAIAGCPVPAASLGTVYVRYRNADTRGIEEIARRMEAEAVRARTVEDSPRFFLAASVAEFAELLRESEHAQGSDYRKVAEILAGVSRRLPLDTRVKEVADLAARAEGLARAR